MRNMNSNELTHFDANGQAHMVDVGDKPHTKRVAIAEGCIHMSAAAYDKLTSGTSKKGDVLGIARIAAIQAAKQNGFLIPLCHPIGLTRVTVDFDCRDDDHTVRIQVQTETVGQTGVEMEALTAASVGLLTIYDMLKAVDRGMVIDAIQLLHKEGGKSGSWQR